MNCALKVTDMEHLTSFQMARLGNDFYDLSRLYQMVSLILKIDAGQICCVTFESHTQHAHMVKHHSYVSL